MRFTCILLAVLAVAGCRVPYSSDIADMTVMSDGLPPAGTPGPALSAWFQEQGYAPGPRVHQSVASLMRRPGDALVYAQAQDKQWWLTQSRSVRDFCVTTRTVFYRLSPDGALEQAIQNHRSTC